MRTPPLRIAAATVLGLRIAYGVALIAAPARLGRPWLGAPADSGPTQIPLQALGMREIVLHTGALLALLQGAALRPWLVGSIAGDLTDAVATVARRTSLPGGAARSAVLVGGGSAALSAALAAALER